MTDQLIIIALLSLIPLSMVNTIIKCGKLRTRIENLVDSIKVLQRKHGITETELVVKNRLIVYFVVRKWLKELERDVRWLNIMKNQPISNEDQRYYILESWVSSLESKVENLENEH